MKWKGKLIDYIIEELKDDFKWRNTIEKLLTDTTIGIHLAVFNEPYLSLIFNGKKKIESRFSINKISPYQKLKKGDIVILKESGGMVTGVFVAGKVIFYDGLDKELLNEIELNYGKDICADYDKDFWEKRTKAKYASLIEVNKIKKITPFKSEKKDRSGWSILRPSLSVSLFNNQRKDIKLKSVITIIGRISSGKSYSAKLIQTHFKFPVASFGSYLKYYCEQNNLPIDRKTLQNIGEIFVKKNPKQFLIDIISHFIGKADTIILEGVRHKSIFEGINQLSENHLAIFIDADLQTRYNRYYNRDKKADEVKSFEQFEISEAHSVEQEIESLKPFCDLVIDSNEDYSSKLFDYISKNLKG